MAVLDLNRTAGHGARTELIYPGDTLDVVAITGDEDDLKPWQLRVDQNGAVNVPLVGPVRVAGANLQQAENVIREASVQRRVFRDPSVRVAVHERRVNRVTVTGAVKNPGTHELPAAGSYLGAAILAAGGLTEHADRFVEVHQPVRRPTGPNNAESARIDLASATVNPNQSLYLIDGSAVTVASRPDRHVHLIGLTGNKTIDLPPNRNIRLLDALAQGGRTRYSTWIADKVHVLRHHPDTGETVTIRASIRAAKRDSRSNLLLASGDVVSVEENPVTFTLSTLGNLIGIGTNVAVGTARF